mmetsp:Transcript_38823/g.119999  ORF Transcript_38823/g.119999 Transcript_38823/m.119999 type:complete len:81 (-) Transcript_38823:158-400(-)
MCTPPHTSPRPPNCILPPESVNAVLMSHPTRCPRFNSMPVSSESYSLEAAHAPPDFFCVYLDTTARHLRVILFVCGCPLS